MRILVRLALCGVLAGGCLLAQRGGGMGIGRGGGGGAGVGRMGGGSGVGVARSGGFSGFGHVGGGFGHAGFGGLGTKGFTGSRFFGGANLHGSRFFVGSYYPWYGYGLGFGYGYGLGYGYGGYWPGFYDYYPSYTYGAGYSYPSPNVTVVYPPSQEQAASGPVYVERARPISHEYDQYGQEIRPSGSANASPIYLLAFNDHSIAAASSYSVEGRTVHYVTMQREAKQAPLDAIDRELTAQLNRERHVQVQLPQ